MATTPNMGTTHISAATITAINEALDKLATALDPVLVNLDPRDRQRYGSINEQNKLFVNKVRVYALTDTQLRDPEVDWDEFEKDYQDREALEKMIVTVNGMLSGLVSAKTLHDYDNFQDALDDYAYTKYKAGGKTPGFDAKNNELKQFFPRKSKKDKPKPGGGDDIHLPEK